MLKKPFAMPPNVVACEMRMSPSDPCLPFTAEQTFGVVGIDFRWKARARIARWLPVTIIDASELHREFFRYGSLAFAR